MSGADNRFCEIKLPFKSRTWALAITTSSAAIQIPADWHGKQIAMQADGGKVYLQAGSSVSITADDTARSTVASNAVTVIGDNCVGMIPDGDTAYFTPRTDNTTEPDTHIAVKGSAACVLRCWISEHPARDGR